MKRRGRHLVIASVLMIIGVCVIRVRDNAMFVLHETKCCHKLGKECITCLKLRMSCASKPNQPHCYGHQLPEKGDSHTKSEAAMPIGMESKSSALEYEISNNRAAAKSIDTIMVAISSGKRRGYTQFTASVLRQYSEIPFQEIYLFPQFDMNVKKVVLMKWYGVSSKAFPAVEKITTSNELEQILRFFLVTSYRYVLMISDDMILSKGWREFILNNINKTDGVLSTYHSAVMHSFDKECEEKEDDLCIGKQIAKYGVVVTKSKAMIILELINSGKIAGGINWEMISNHTNSRLCFPTQSFAMMIGQTNQTGEYNCGVNEVPYKFNRCEFPQWIQDGIEFYFDRCTSPQEEYIPGSSINDINREKRFWTRPVVSYSLYGGDDSYIKTALANAQRVFSVYPGWKIWIYTDFSIPKDALENLCALDVRFVNMSGTNISTKMAWRFLVASEPVKMYAVRDADSYLLPRGKAAVDEWLRSGRKFHVMRDHPQHSKLAMLAGMWGGLHDAIPDLREMLISRNFTNRYSADQGFLRRFVWGRAKESVWAHDSHSIHKFGEDHPFPSELENPKGFVGRIVIRRKKTQT